MRKNQNPKRGETVEQDQEKNTYGDCNTPGFKLRDTPKAVFDHRGYWKVELPRKNKRLIPTSEFLVRSNRAHGDVGFMLYDKSPMRPSASEISKVVGYIVDYASKSTETEKQKRQIKVTEQ